MSTVFLFPLFPYALGWPVKCIPASFAPTTERLFLFLPQYPFMAESQFCPAFPVGVLRYFQVLQSSLRLRYIWHFWACYHLISIVAINLTHGNMKNIINRVYTKETAKDTGMTGTQFEQLPGSEHLERFNRYKKAAICSNR